MKTKWTFYLVIFLIISFLSIYCDKDKEINSNISRPALTSTGSTITTITSSTTNTTKELVTLTLTSHTIIVENTDIYVAGSTDGRIGYWKNYVFNNIDHEITSSVKDIYVENNDIYLYGMKNGNHCIWKNGQISMLPISITSSFNELYVKGQDVYLVGQYIDGTGNPQACYVENGVLTDLKGTSYYSSDATSIYKENGNLYIGGYYSENNKRFVCCWENSAINDFYEIDDNSYSGYLFLQKAIYKFGSLCAAGIIVDSNYAFMKNMTAYWIDGSYYEGSQLDGMQLSGFIFSMDIDANKNVYFCGSYSFYDDIRAYYWKNDSQTYILDMILYSFHKYRSDREKSHATSLSVSNNKVYVAGQYESFIVFDDEMSPYFIPGGAYLWIDGEFSKLPGSDDAKVSSIFIVEKT